MRKIFGILMAATLVLGMAACSDKDNDSDKDTDTTSGATGGHGHHDKVGDAAAMMDYNMQK